MLNSFILLVIALIFFAALFYLAYYLSRFFVNYKPGKKRLDKDLRKMKEELQPMIEKLVPWTQEEMELLSLNSKEKVKKSIGAKTRIGILFSIYHEPLIAYAKKEYSEGEYSLLYARTSNHEYIYRSLPERTEVYIDGSAIGRLVNKNELRDPQNKIVLARCYDSGQRLTPVILNNKEVGQLVDINDKEKVNPRAYEFLQEMSEAERLSFMAITIPLVLGQVAELK